MSEALLSPPPTIPHADRRDSLTWKPLRFLTLYRLTLAGLLVALFFAISQSRALGSDQPVLFAVTSLAYLLLALVFGFSTRLRRPRFSVQVFTQITVDILAITVMMHASGGIESGLGILLILAVASGAMLLPGRMAFFFAALAALAVLAELGLSFLQEVDFTNGHLTRAGILGIMIFTVATLASLLARRIQESEALAEQRGVDLANLARLNEYIVQRLQAGILVVDNEDRIRLVNNAALVMLNIPANMKVDRLEDISPVLHASLRSWREDPERQPESFQTADGDITLQPRFMQLGNVPGAATLVSLEDTALMAQQAQQMKLAGLGRLTASIAHEIRNPLAAISHAEQLLKESPNLRPEDRRLTTIIENHAGRVNGIVENVLQLSRRGAAAPQRILLADWLNEYVEDLIDCHELDPDNVDIDIQPIDIQIEFDPGHLQQLIGNLLTNALHHAGRTVAHPEIRLLGRLTDTGAPYLDIMDNGPGIDAETRSKIFEPFFTTSAEGTGLGLYLSRELAEANRARLTYHDREGGGSCFRISFIKSI